jgi:hypothetical protein
MRLTENQLRDIIRNIILREGAVTPEQLSDDYTVVIKDNGIVVTPLKSLGRVDMKERFADLDPNTIINMPSYSIYIKYKYTDPKLPEPVEDLFAELEMRKWVGMCNDAWEVYWAEVHKDYKMGGFGPLMYDVAMELAGKFGLICDRNSVSNEAARVWNHYLEIRSDVYTEDIDIENCPSDMTSTNDRIAISKGADQPWHQKVYFSTHYMSGGGQKPVIDALHRAGRLEWERHVYPGEK